MKKIISIIFIITILSFCLVNKYLPKNQILNPAPLKNTNNMLSLMLEQEDGTYQEAKETSWPQEAYIFNAKMSKCEKGSKLSWNVETKQIQITANKSDKCYVYFDKYNFAKSCLAGYENNLSCEILKNGQKINNLYYHNQDFPYGANDLSYRFSGNNSVVNNNYLCIDNKTIGTCTSDDDLYRIIGLFKNDDNFYEIKVIENTLKDNIVWDTNNLNEWDKSSLKKYLNEEFYDSLISKNSKYQKIIKHKWSLTGFGHSNNYAKDIYNIELGITVTPSFIDDYIGLMYGSDYAFASSPETWSSLTLYYFIPDNDWLYTAITEWTISKYRNSDTSLTFQIWSTGEVHTHSVNLAYSARVVFYLDSQTQYLSGDGTKTNPYRIAI